MMLRAHGAVAGPNAGPILSVHVVGRSPDVRMNSTSTRVAPFVLPRQTGFDSMDVRKHPGTAYCG